MARISRLLRPTTTNGMGSTAKTRREVILAKVSVLNVPQKMIRAKDGLADVTLQCV